MNVRNKTIEFVAHELWQQYQSLSRRLRISGIEPEQQVVINQLSLIYINAFRKEALLDDGVYAALNNRINEFKANKAIFRSYDRNVIFSAMQKALETARDEQIKAVQAVEQAKQDALRSAKDLINFFKLNDLYQQEKNIRVQKINQLVAMMSSGYYENFKDDIADILAANKQLNEQITKRYQDQHQALLEVTNSRLEDLSTRNLTNTLAYQATERVQRNLLSHKDREMKSWVFYRDHTVNAYQSLFVKDKQNKCDYDHITEDKSKSANRFAMVIQMISSSLSLSMAAVTFVSIVHSLVTRGHIFYMQPKSQDFAECTKQVQKNLNIS